MHELILYITNCHYQYEYEYESSRIYVAFLGQNTTQKVMWSVVAGSWCQNTWWWVICCSIFNQAFTSKKWFNFFICSVTFQNEAVGNYLYIVHVWNKMCKFVSKYIKVHVPFCHYSLIPHFSQVPSYSVFIWECTFDRVV